MVWAAVAVGAAGVVAGAYSSHKDRQAAKEAGEASGPAGGNPTDLFFGGGGSHVTSNQWNNVQRVNEGGTITRGRDLARSATQGGLVDFIRESRDPTSMSQRAQFQGGGGMFGGHNNVGIQFDPSGDIQRQNAMRNFRDDRNMQTAVTGGLEGFFGPGANQGMNQNLFQQGQDIIGGGFQGAAQSRYDLLTQQAQPGIERQTNALTQKLFSMGQLGTSGGALQTEAFGRGLGEADVQRQLAGQQLGQQELQRGQALMGLGFQGQQRDQANQQMMGQMFGQQLGRSVGQSNEQFNQRFRMDAMNNQRAQDRMAASQGLFNFGTNIEDRAFQQGQQGLAMEQSMDAEARSALALRADIMNPGAGTGSGQRGGQGGGSTAGDVAGGVSGFLGGLSGQMMANPGMFSSGSGSSSGTSGTTLGGAGTAWDSNFGGSTGLFG